jgi:4-hydroxy-3-methylbut-2-enyl diphosphate reductase
MLQKIILASPRGFCAGVKRAITTVEKALHVYGTPLYVRHQIVHNEWVVKNLEQKGVLFVENLEDIPAGDPVVFSAHGVAPKIRVQAEQQGFKVIDATCPLVMKVHLEAKRYHEQGFSIIYIGHSGHQEVLGTMGEAPMHLISSLSDIPNLRINNPEKIVCLTQTTLSLNDTAQIMRQLKRKYPQLITPPKKDICDATQNRQNAVRALSQKVDLILVIGSQNSSNSNRLVDIAKHHQLPAYLIADKTQINPEWLKNIKILGITSGASVPEELVLEVINYLNVPLIEELKVVAENLHFEPVI